MNKFIKEINIYTDGSCNPTYKIGGWAAILVIDGQDVLLKGKELQTTHNRMELLSVIKALDYIKDKNLIQHKIIINSDSQYAVKLIDRKEQILNAKFLTKKGTSIKNKSLVEKIFNYIEYLNLAFVKVKAHQKKSDLKNYNRDVDKISRKIVREYVRRNCTA